MAPEAADDAQQTPGATAITRVFSTVELVEKILRFIDHKTFSNSCPLVSKFWHSVISGSSQLNQTFHLSPSPISEILIWRYKNSSPVRTPIQPFDLRPKLKLSYTISDLDSEPRTWDRVICQLHPELEVMPSISPRTIADIKFNILDDEDATGPWLNAYITQPPCTMRQIYIQKFVDIRRSAHRMKRYLDAEDGGFATLGKVRNALMMMTREESGERNLGEALIKKFDGDKSMFIEGFIHTDAVLVELARKSFPDAVDPSC